MTMMPKKRSGAWKWVVALVLLVGGLAGWRWYQSLPKETPIDYKTAPITRGDVTQTVTANGQINAVTNVAVGSQVSGIITAIKADFNSTVTNGQVVAQIDPSTYQQNITQAEAELANAAAGLEMAELNMRRTASLRSNDLVSASEYDQTVVNLHQAQAVVKTREASLKKTQVDLERTTIYAPIDGIIISRLVDVGQTVAASFNAPTLFSIANDLRNMRIEAMVSEADVGGVQDGQQATFIVEAFSGRKFRGQISQVRYAPITNQNVVNYTTLIAVNNDDLKLRPGMTANASIIIAERRDVLRIPNAALRFRPPEGAKGATNAPARAPGGGTNTALLAAAAPNSQAGDRPSREERRRRLESMTPEQQEQMRARFREGGAGGPGGSGRGPGGGARAAQDGPATRSVYVIEKSAERAKTKPVLSSILGWVPGLAAATKENSTLKPLTIKTGISDGAFTEVLEGLNEHDLIVTGIDVPLTAAAARPPAGASPFGGPSFGGGMRPR